VTATSSRPGIDGDTGAGLGDVADLCGRIATNVQRVIVGKPDVVRVALVTLLAEGHLLVEDVPGVGKTSLAKALARSIDCAGSRVQFTPDLLPGDITGLSVFNRQTAEFEFRPGPVFANIVIADEINRASPKTQSALLECMAEHQVTVDGATYALASPFMVVATQNPIEQQGTYPLPEAQLDRFLFKVFLPYPTNDELQRILGITTQADLPTVDPVLARSIAPQRVEELKRVVREVLVAPHLEQYAAALVRATVPSDSRFAPLGKPILAPSEAIERYVSFGSSPRGGQALLLGAKVRALLAGRANITHEDIDSVAVAALNHRLVLNFAAQAEGIDPRTLIEGVLHDGRRLHS